MSLTPRYCSDCGGALRDGEFPHDCEGHRKEQEQRAEEARRIVRELGVQILSIEELQLADGKDALGMEWPYERCKSSRCCGRRVNVGFVVSDEDWEAVVGNPGTILCLTCFDEMAQEKGIEYKVIETAVVTWAG